MLTGVFSKWKGIGSRPGSESLSTSVIEKHSTPTLFRGKPVSIDSRSWSLIWLATCGEGFSHCVTQYLPSVVTLDASIRWIAVFTYCFVPSLRVVAEKVVTDRRTD